MDANTFLERLRLSSHYRGQIAHVERLGARPARYAELSVPLPEPLPAVLKTVGIDRLYEHQVAAIEHLRARRDVVVVTSTASGKTLCYNLPVLETLLRQPRSRALYLFPTKALAQDQLQALRRLMDAAPGFAAQVRAGVYDGDTPQSTRRKLRDEASILLSNPDMLHSGMLPYHTRWARFWANLETVVVDEVHSYRGIFGSNVANVLRRLDRLCAHYGSRPRYICCSATIANPRELAERLLGRPVEVVENDGSPKGEKLFVCWNPPHRDEAQMERASSNVEAERLMVDLIRQGVRTIAFGRARIVAELLYRYVREELRRDGPRLANAVRAYRGGYLAAERREIERMLFSGELMGVTSTNALELGVDIGGLDAAIITGFPGTVASTWQQAGRAGRGEDPALVFLIAYNEPIDQFIMRHPEYILGRSPEHATIDPENPYILAGHLACAAAEMPLRSDDSAYFGARTLDVADALADDGRLHRMADAYYWAQPEQPSHRLNLRTISDNTFTIVETSESNRVIGEVDAISAPELVYPEAVYIHKGETYFVETLDLVNKVAYTRRTDMDYYTQAILESLIRIRGEERRKAWRGSAVHYGEVTVTWSTVAFKKIQFYSTDSLGWGRVDIPPQHLETMGTWLTPSLAAVASVKAAGRNPTEGLVGIRNTAVHLLPMLAMCDKQDIGGIVDAANTGSPSIFLYDRYQGGLGFSEQGYEQIEHLLQSCLSLIRECPCAEGCPSCVGIPILRPPIHTDPDAGGGFPIPDKEGARLLLEAMLAGKDPVRGAEGLSVEGPVVLGDG
jgi:DEAD/DEAH box helicase domain-containing protein